MRSTRSVSKIDDNPNKLKVTLAAKTAKEIIRVKNVNTAADLRNLTQDRWEMGEAPVIAVAAGKTLAPATAKATADTGKDATKTDAAKDTADRSKETRLVVVGSVEFANNQGAQSQENRDMFMNMTNYLLQDDNFIAIRPKDPTKSTLHITSGRSQLSLLLLAFVYPFGFLGGGTLYWLKRRRA